MVGVATAKTEALDAEVSRAVFRFAKRLRLRVGPQFSVQRS